MNRRMFLTAAAGTLLAGNIVPALAGETPINENTFDGLIASGKPVLVHVHADWCPTCRVQTPILGAIRAKPEFANLPFVQVDFDRDLDFRKKYGVGQQATILVIKGDKVLARSTMQTDPALIEAMIRHAL